ncbi:MAG: hypothetical protein KJN97_01150 [Deltaproteobacteria bacterium]|nr:hypothetical protein [Deltaproteobacteria bacterium]
MSTEPVRSTEFALGRTVITRGALDALEGEDVHAGIARHASGDWGDVCPEDKQANDDALRVGTRLLSVYHTGSGQKFWVITAADRSATTVLLPEEY